MNLANPVKNFSVHFEFNNDIIVKLKDKSKNTVTKYHNCMTGKESESVDEVKRDRNIYLIENCKPKMVTLVSTHQIGDYMVLSKYLLNILNINENEIRLPQEENQIFISKQGQLYKANLNDSKTLVATTIKDSFFHGLGNKSVYPLEDLNKQKMNTFSHIAGKFFGEVIFTSKGVIKWDCFSDMRDYISALQSNDIIDYENMWDHIPLPKLPEIDTLNRGNTHPIAVIQKGPVENSCLIRTFFVSKWTNKVFENSRIYVSRDGIKACCQGKPVDLKKDAISKWNFLMPVINEEATIGTPLEHIVDILKEVPVYKRCIAIKEMLSHPIIEKLYKAGFDSYVLYLLSKTKSSSPIERIEDDFGGLKEANDLLQAVGVNKYEVNLLKQEFNDVVLIDKIGKRHYTASNKDELKSISYSSIKFIKTLIVYSNNMDLTAENVIITPANTKKISIANIDQRTFKTLFDFHSNIVAKLPNWGDYIKYLQVLILISKMYGLQTACKMCDKIKSLDGIELKTNQYGYWYKSAAIKVFFNYLDMIMQLGEQQNIKPDFEDSKDLEKKHNNLFDIYEVAIKEIDAKKWEEAKEIWKKYTFEDEQFVVRYPQVPDDLAHEGFSLNHCAKNYITIVTNQFTNVLFIRQKKCPDTPFFTVEVSNSNVIEQVHGFANKNASAQKGLEQFLKKWATAKNLTFGNYNQTR